MNYCETCKSWKPCGRGSRVGECVHPKVRNQGTPPVGGLAQGDLMTNLKAYILTDEDFGCIWWNDPKGQEAEYRHAAQAH